MGWGGREVLMCIWSDSETSDDILPRIMCRADVMGSLFPVVQ